MSSKEIMQKGETSRVLQIRKMERADAAEVSRLEAEIFTKPWSQQGFLDALSGENVIFLVAESLGKIVGYCGMYCAADEGEITNVAVAPEARNRGVGKLLMAQFLEEAKKAGARQVILEVRVSNEAALHLYEKFGFSVCGIRKDFYEEPVEDAYVMTLSQ